MGGIDLESTAGKQAAGQASETDNTVYQLLLLPQTKRRPETSFCPIGRF
jgi:hypothetical protein